MAIFFRRKGKIVLALLLSVFLFPVILKSIEQFRYNDFKNRFNDEIYVTHKFYSPFEIKQIPGSIIDLLAFQEISTNTAPPGLGGRDWSKYAYVNYVNNMDYLCNSVVIFKTLKKKFNSKAKMVLLISDTLYKNASSEDEVKNINAQLEDAVQFLSRDVLDIKIVSPPQDDSLKTSEDDKNSNLKKRLFDFFSKDEQDQNADDIQLDNDGIEATSGKNPESDNKAPVRDESINKDNTPPVNPARIANDASIAPNKVAPANNAPVINAPVTNAPAKNDNPNEAAVTGSNLQNNKETLDDDTEESIDNKQDDNMDESTDNKQDEDTMFDHNSIYTKYSMFNAMDYERIIYIDNDALLNNNLDELFFLPDFIEFAAPLQFWKIPVESAEASIKYQQDNGVDISLNNHLSKLHENIMDGRPFYNFLPDLPPSLYFKDKSIMHRILKTAEDKLPFLDFDELGITSAVQFQTSLMVIKPKASIFNDIAQNILPNLESSQITESHIINKSIFNLRNILFKQFDEFEKNPEEFKPKVMILPYKRYGLLTKSLRDKEHYPMLINDMIGYYDVEEAPKHKRGVDLVRVASTIKYLHFNEDLYNKPWRYNSIDELKCEDKASNNHQSENAACKLWIRQYDRFLAARKMCRISQEQSPSIPAKF